jgi:hypothetical protein
MEKVFGHRQLEKMRAKRSEQLNSLCQDWTGNSREIASTHASISPASVVA